MIENVVIHLLNDLPILADIEAMPGAADLNVRCTNVRTVDGKRPQFVHDTRGTFVFPLSVIRLIEAPADASFIARASDGSQLAAPTAPPRQEESLDESDEDLLARIRAV